jgi:hypothetical protein
MRTDFHEPQWFRQSDGIVNLLTTFPEPWHNPSGDAPSMIKRTHG